MNNLINLKQDISKRIIKNPVFSNHSKSLKLTDNVVLYNDGMHWKAIPQTIMLSYPVIHDNYDNKIITIYSCPFTLFSCVYFEEFIPGTHVYNNNLTLINENKNTLLVPIIGSLFNKEDMTILDNYIRKGEAKIMTLRNAISLFPDILFMDTENVNVNININIKKLLVNPDYSKKYSAKQIVYIIEYHSKKQEKLKYSVVIPKNNTFDISKNKFLLYFNKMIDKIRDKGGHIYTCYLSAWSATHANSKYKLINI